MRQHGLWGLRTMPERFTKVLYFSAHEVPARFGHSAFFNRKLLLGDTIESRFIPFTMGERGSPHNAD